MKLNKNVWDCFKKASNAEELVAEGTDGAFGINWTFIQSKIIYLAGRYCDRFASDILQPLFNIDECLNNGSIETESRLFGFREEGVDHAEFVVNRYADQYMYSNPYGAQYRALWRLDIDVEENDYASERKTVKMRFYQVNKSISESKIKQALAFNEEGR